MKVLTDLNMNNNQIIEVIIHKVKTDPTISSNNAGMIIFNETDKKLKYCNGTEWVIIGNGSGGGQTITIDTILSNESTNSNAAGSKAVVDYVRDTTKDLSAFINTIKIIGNNKVLMKDASGVISGIGIDSEVKENSNNLIRSDSVYKAINDSKITKSDYSCPLLTGENGICTWTISLNHSNPVFIQIYDKSGEVVFPNIKSSNNQIIITFNGITNNRITAGSYSAVIISNN